MPFEIVRNDIVNMKTDAIVNTANPRPVVGPGADAGIHAKAGPRLLKARQAIGDIPVGHAAVTPGYKLDAKYVIHTVGPMWEGGGSGEEALLRRCYRESLALAAKKRCRSVAFPLISAENYGFPKDRALQIAVGTITEFLMEHEMDVFLTVFGRDEFRLSERLFYPVASFINELYVKEKFRTEYVGDSRRERRRMQHSGNEVPARPAAVNRPGPVQRPAAPDVFSYTELPEPLYSQCEDAAPMEAFHGAPEQKAKEKRGPLSSLAAMLRRKDAGFSETLLRMIDESGKKDAEIYKKANIDRRLFSKIRSNSAYQPSKTTALALAVALELDLEQTRDLIGRAGYALSRSSKFDIIVEYFISSGNYNIHEINLTLFEFDQSLLGGRSA